MLCPSCFKEIPDGSMFCNVCGKKATTTQVTQKDHPASRIWGLVLLLLAAFAGWHFYEISYGSNQASRTLAAAVRAPITLTDQVENLPASSWKPISVDVPYDGMVAVQVQVQQGNAVDVYLTTADQLDLMTKKTDWKDVKVDSDFNAAKTKTFRRTGHLSKGVYFLVLRDTSLGILSARTSDIDVKINLNP